MRRRTLLAAALPGLSTVALAGCVRPPWRDGIAAESVADVTFREEFAAEYDDAFDRVTERDRPPAERVYEVVNLTDESPLRYVIRGRIPGRHRPCSDLVLHLAEVVDGVLEVHVATRSTDQLCPDVVVSHPFEAVFTFDAPADVPDAVDMVGFDD